MKPSNRWIWFVLVLMLACLPLTACGPASSAAASGPGTEEENKPIKIEHIANNALEPTREVLTEQAAKRLDIQTAKAQLMQVNGKQQTVIPYSAVLYDNQGNTWTYTNPSPLTFVRHQIRVEHIEGDRAVLSSRLPAGTQVVTVGAEELYGSEFEFEEE